MHGISTTNPELPHVPSPFEGKQLRMIDHFKLSAYWFGSNFVWGALLGPVMAKQMELLEPDNTTRTLGTLYALGAIPALLVPLLLGPLSDRCTHRWGRRRPYIFGGGMLGLFGLLFMFGASSMNSLIFYVLGYFILQCGSNTALAAYSGVIPDLVPAEQRGTASGYMAFMSQVSTLFGAVLGGVLIKDAKDPFVVYAMLFLVFAAFLYLSFKGITENRLEGDIPPFDIVQYVKGLWLDPRQYPDFAWVWITRALMMLGFYAIQPYILFYLRDMAQVANPQASTGPVFGILLLAATISGVVGGIVSDKTGRKPIVYIASAMISVMSVAFIFCHSLEQVLVAGVIFGLGYVAYISVDWALGTDVLPRKEDAGKDMAVWHVSMTLPQQIAPLLAGFVLNLHKIPGAANPVRYDRGGYTFVFAFSAICFALGAILVRNVRGSR